MAAPDYKNPPRKLPVYIDTPETIASKTEEFISGHKAVLDKIVAEVTEETATFANVMTPILAFENEAAKYKYAIDLYQYVSADAALREASTKSTATVGDYSVDSMMREDVFKLVDAAYRTREAQNLDAEDLHALETERANLVNQGLLLKGAERERFMEVSKRLNQLTVDANQFFNSETGIFWVAPERLAGVSKDDIDPDTLEKGTGENEGKVGLNFKYTHLNPILKNAHDEELRRDYFMAENSKLNVAIPTVSELFRLRDESGRLLGYKNHADSRLSVKMAKNSETVWAFLNDLRTRIAAGIEKEIEVLAKLKKEDCEARGIPYTDFYAWDTQYYSRILLEKEYSIDETAISEYFPILPTFNGILGVYEELFGMKFIKLEEEDRARLSPTGKAEDVVWNEEVFMYSVWDSEASGGAFLGYFYLDLHPRPNKYGHYASFNLESGSNAPDGSRNIPCTALVCNFSRPSAGKPALLKHAELVTFFHELGHGIHDLVSKTKNARTHGTETVRDFVEAPSQMLENWCWDATVLERLSGHWETGEKIPKDLVEKLIGTRHVNSAIYNSRQSLIGVFDMAVHAPKSSEELKSMNFTRKWNELRAEISIIKGPEDAGFGMDWGGRWASVNHFYGGYDAGYYGYMWSLVFSADMFASNFAGNPMNAAEGRRYRQMILEKGGSLDEMSILEAYLGRKPNNEAFYKSVGLA